MITKKGKSGELFKANEKQRKLSETEIKRDRMIWDTRNSDWTAMHETNGQLESQKTELRHAIQLVCQAQMESRGMFEELTTRSGLIKRLMH